MISAKETSGSGVADHSIYSARAKEATLSEVVIRKLFQVAANGSPHALGHVIRNITDAQAVNQALIREEVERGNRIKQRLQIRLEQAVRNGADPVWVVPHPDDLIIDEEEGWSMNGPMDEEKLRPIRQRVAMRSVLLLQSVLDERLSDAPRLDESDRPAVETAGSTSMVLANLLNGNLPERFRLSVTGMMFETMRYERLTKRELLKATRAAWAAIGQPKPRGSTLPPWSEAGPRMKQLLDVLNDVLQQMRSGALVGEGAVATKLTEMLRR